jgi:uncharacterized protein YndB with AHSA1/START domain
MTVGSARHATFVIERCYFAEPRRVFAAWAEGEARQVWMDDPDFRSDGSAYELDFRVGGRERYGGLAADGVNYQYEALIYDIVPNRRVVYGYAMYSGGARISVSLTTVQIAPHSRGAQLTYTEQGTWLDRVDTPEAREGEWTDALDQLGAYLATRTADGAQR